MHKVWHRTNTLKFGHFDHAIMMHGKHRVSVEVPHLMHNFYSFTYDCSLYQLTCTFLSVPLNGSTSSAWGYQLLVSPRENGNYIICLCLCE